MAVSNAAARRRAVLRALRDVRPELDETTAAGPLSREEVAMSKGRITALALFLSMQLSAAGAAPGIVPPSARGAIEAERLGTHDGSNIRTLFWNYGMVGDYPQDPLHVDLSVFHSLEAPKGSG
jgi:hypothetical protein